MQLPQPRLPSPSIKHCLPLSPRPRRRHPTASHHSTPQISLPPNRRPRSRTPVAPRRRRRSRTPNPRLPRGRGPSRRSDDGGLQRGAGDRGSGGERARAARQRLPARQLPAPRRRQPGLLPQARHRPRHHRCRPRCPLRQVLLHPRPPLRRPPPPGRVPGRRHRRLALRRPPPRPPLPQRPVTVGPCNVPKPRAWNPVEQSKWTSWHGLGSMVSGGNASFCQNLGGGRSWMVF